MDRRNWPWKKKSLDKTTNEKLAGTSESVSTSLSSLASLEDQENYKKVNYVQIPMDSYKHFTGLENQVSELKDQARLFEDEVKELKEQLSMAHHEITTKEILVIQHAKVAEDAVSGWEKADAESSALKRQLESVTMLKVIAEERASHLDDALKECTRQIRNSKEESEQRLHDVLRAKTIDWDEIKLDLEGKIDELNQGLLRAAAENAAFSRSLQERSNLIARFSEEKSRADAEIESLKCNIKSYEKEIGGLKYDLHLASKELEIRNEEKNMSLKSAEIANKQQLDGVKKIARLEAECQRLRCLLRKKLPGPAALAQMKLEAENLGHEFTDSRTKGDAVQNFSAHVSLKPEISIDRWEGCRRENELLNSRMLAMEEETRRLKESLAARDSELQVSRNLCAKTLGKVKTLEAQIQLLNQQKDSPKPSLRNPAESPSSRNGGYQSSATSISEDGFDEDGSSMGSRAPLSSDSCNLRITNNVPEFRKLEKVNNLELMDDFLEVERLAAYAADGISGSITSDKSRDCKVVDRSLDEALDSSDHHFVKTSTVNAKLGSGTHLLDMLRSRIYRIFESQNEETNLKKVVEDIVLAIQETEGSSPHHVSCVSEVVQTDQLSSQETEPWTNIENITKQDLDSAVSHIHQFMASIINGEPELLNVCGNKLREKLENFSASINKFTSSEKGLIEFVINLSGILSEASDLKFGLLGRKLQRPGLTASDCVDKVALLVNEADKSSSDPSEKMCLKECPCSCHSGSEMVSLLEDHLSNSLGAEVTLFKCLLKELERLKSEKSDMELILARLEQDHGDTKSELQGKEQLVSELKSQLASSQNLHSLAETQLKCVTESYKSLEVHTQELEANIKHLQEKKEELEIALSEEKQALTNAQDQCKDLQEKLQRGEKWNSSSPVAHAEPQARQENDIADAAEKLAACQETIYLLGKQLQALQYNAPQSQADESVAGNPNQSFSKSQEFFCQNNSDQAEIDSVSSNNPSDVKPSLSFRSEVNPSQANLTFSTSTSFSSSSKFEEEKHPRGLGRFFSSRGNNGHSKK